MKLFKNINLNKLKDGLSKTRNNLVTRITEVVSGKAQIDEDVLDEIEEILITSDLGFNIATEIIENTRKELKSESDRTKLNIIDTVKSELTKIISRGNEISLSDQIEKFNPYVILIVGVNGAGKTTTIGKLAYNFKQSGLKVVIGSADTFRAAANEQLEVWANRAEVEIVQREAGADPSAVAYDTLSVAQKKNADVVLIDTAGRLHTKNNLMEELKKIKKVISKVVEHAPNETFLVIDGNTGQNGLVQANEFSKYTDLTGLIVTKLDGTAKGGIIFQICNDLEVPVKYIGVGEGIDDLQTFDASAYVNAIFEEQ